MLISAEVGGSIAPYAGPPPRSVLIQIPVVGAHCEPIGINTTGSIGLLNNAVPGVQGSHD